MNLFITIPGMIAETFIICNYWFSMLERRYSKKKSLIIFWCVQIFNLVKSILMFNCVAPKIITTFVIMMVLMGILFKDRFYRKIIVYISYMMCVIVGESIAMLLAEYVYNHNITDVTTHSFTGNLWQLSAYLFIYIFSIIVLILLKNKKINPESKVVQYLYLYIGVQCLIVLVFTVIIVEYKIIPSVLIFIMAIVILTSGLVGYLLYRAIKHAALRAAEAEYIKKEAEMKDKQFLELKEQYIEYRKLRHDFYNHIRVIHSLKNEDKIKEYVNEIKARFDKMEQVSWCNNLTLDALLALKRSEAVQKGIDVSFQVCDCERLSVTDFDLCIVVSNLLDNAIEASSQTDKKYLEMSITRKLDRLVITVKNSSVDVSEKLETTKSDSENHGIGIGNIRSVVKKYDGDVFFRYKNGEFTSIVNFKIT